LFEHPGEYGYQIGFVLVFDDRQNVVKVPAHDHQAVHEYGHLFDGLLIQCSLRFASISGHNDELADGGQ